MATAVVTALMLTILSDWFNETFAYNFIGSLSSDGQDNRNSYVKDRFASSRFWKLYTVKQDLYVAGTTSPAAAMAFFDIDQIEELMALIFPNYSFTARVEDYFVRKE